MYNLDYWESGGARLPVLSLKMQLRLETICLQTVKTLVRLSVYIGSPEASLFVTAKKENNENGVFLQPDNPISRSMKTDLHKCTDLRQLRSNCM